MDKLEERLRYTASILDANASKFTVPDHIPQKAAALREAADALAAKQALIDELVEGLEPFAQAWENADISGSPIAHFIGAPPCKRARSLISKARSSGKAGSDA